METVECKDLLDWAVKLETAIGQKRVSLALEFADLCIAGLPQAVKKYGKQLQTGRPLRPRRPDFARVATAISQVIESNELLRIMSLMDAIEAIDDALVYARDELWREMHRSLREHSGSPAQSLKETAWHIRNRTRYTGRNVASRSLSTTLLVKGLEFDHAAVLDVADHATAEELYVALTRGARSLTVISASPILKRPRPHFVVAAAGR